MPIIFYETTKLFLLHTPHSTYAMKVLPSGELIHLHWGARIERPEDFPAGPISLQPVYEEKFQKNKLNEEYPAWGGYLFNEPALKATFADHVRDVRLVYATHRIEQGAGVETLTVTLVDMHYPLRVHLVYTIHDGLDLIDRSATIENFGAAPITLESVMSATWYVPRGRDYRLTFMSAKWGGEYQLERLMLTQSKTVIEGRRGLSGTEAHPWFALDRAGATTETTGQVWFGALHWSGNHRITIELNAVDQVGVAGGINDFDFSWRLEPGETFTTPIFTAGYSEGGFGSASRTLHDYVRDRLMPEPKRRKVRPILYNTWGAFHFDVHEREQYKIVEKAAQIGVEMYVVDDGWFSTRNDDRSGLGDWTPSATKFPNGLTPLIEKVHSLGMGFGLWVEPEAVNPASKLFERHPDWVLHFPTRDSTQARNQLVLNLARDDVKEYIWSFLDRLLSENDIQYLKWDMNRYLSEAGWPSAPPEEQRSVWVRYVWNLYEIWRRLNETFPQVWFENCAAGGHRVDLGMARYADLVNPSDNRDALDYLRLLEGYSQMYPMCAAIGGIIPFKTGKIVRHASREYMAHVGMMGVTGIDLDFRTCRSEELDQIKAWFDQFKAIRPIIHHGNLYRLESPSEQPYMAVNYVSKDKSAAVLFVLGQVLQFHKRLPNVRLQGLDPEAMYDVQGYRPMTGKALMALGLDVQLQLDYDSRVIQIVKSN
jgi:alpha-galactosidase